MALISMRQLLDHAAENGYGVPAFNVNNLEQTRAIMEAADATNSPVIMQASVPVEEDDTVESLAERVQAKEREIYPKAIQLFAQWRLTIVWRHVDISPPNEETTT